VGLQTAAQKQICDLDLSLNLLIDKSYPLMKIITIEDVYKN